MEMSSIHRSPSSVVDFEDASGDIKENEYLEVVELA
jgi:hypothetical protein